MLKLQDVRISYREVNVINKLNLDVKDGLITVLIGANGVGKTTILNAITGIHKPESGHIFYGEEGKEKVDLTKIPPYKMAKLGIGICPEGRQLFPDMTVLENMEMGAYSRNDSKINDDIQGFLKKFPILEQRKAQRARTLSGGEQEILAIARALVTWPKLLLLDEPSWGLAPLMIAEVMEIVKSIKESTNTTILLVEQNANVALKYADYAYLLGPGGEIALEGAGADLLADERLAAVYLGDV